MFIFFLSVVETGDYKVKGYSYSLDNKSLDLSKSEGFSDGNFIAAQKLIFVFGMSENTVAKGENVRIGDQHFLLFPESFKKS